jgi:hypothetical protein
VFVSDKPFRPSHKVWTGLMKLLVEHFSVSPKVHIA